MVLECLWIPQDVLGDAAKEENVWTNLTWPKEMIDGECGHPSCAGDQVLRLRVSFYSQYNSEGQGREE